MHLLIIPLTFVAFLVTHKTVAEADRINRATRYRHRVAVWTSALILMTVEVLSFLWIGAMLIQ